MATLQNNNSFEMFRKDLDRLFRENHQPMYRAAYGVDQNREEAEDVVQTIFLKLIQGEPPPDFYENPAGYLHRAATNGAISALRARDSRKLTDCDIDSLEIQTPPSESAHADDLSRLQKALAKMNPDLVEVMNLHYKEGYTFVEIAKIRGKTLRAVAMEIYRARNEMKKLIRIEEKKREEQEDQHSSDGRPVVADASEEGSGGGRRSDVEAAGGRA